MSLGFSPDGKRKRRTVRGRTKTEVRDKPAAGGRHRNSGTLSLLSSGVPVEEIARLAGHSSSRTTEAVYQRELRPVLTTGAEAMDGLFKAQAS